MRLSAVGAAVHWIALAVGGPSPDPASGRPPLFGLAAPLADGSYCAFGVGTEAGTRVVLVNLDQLDRWTLARIEGATEECPGLATAAGVAPPYSRLSSATIRLRACTSSEGVHFTAWLGEPGHGTRLWHQYVGLAYSTEPTCNDSDYAPE